MALRHDKALHIVKQQPHLKHVPDYIVPKTLRQLSRAGPNKDYEGFSTNALCLAATGRSNKRKQRQSKKQIDNKVSFKTL